MGAERDSSVSGTEDFLKRERERIFSERERRFWKALENFSRASEDLIRIF